MSKTVNVKYFAKTVFAKEPQKATEESTGYDLYAAEAKTILPGKNDLVSLDLRWAIPKGFCGCIFPHCTIIKDNNVTVEAGLIDADYRGLVYIFLFIIRKKFLQYEQVTELLRQYFLKNLTFVLRK